MTGTQVQGIKYSEIPLSRAWLIAKNGEEITRFAWPPFQGTHQECYQAIAGDSELVPAEGLDLALLAQGAYTSTPLTPQWQSAREYFKNSYVRTPNRVLLIPAGNINGDASLSGILVERDTDGKGLSTKMNVPDLSCWKQNSNGVYAPNDGTYEAVFVPSTAYDGKPFENDGVVHAHLTPEGAELFARTARGAGLVPHDWLAIKMKEIKSPKQLVSLLDEDVDGLALGGDWLGYGGYAFGGRRETAEGSPTE